MKIFAGRRRTFKIVWGFAIACVVIGSLLPSTSGPIQALDRLPVSDKVIHFTAYLVLSILAMVSFERRPKAVLAALLMIVLGGALEGGQTFSPGRQVELGDAVANTLGVLSGILAGLPLQ
jgi:VanZ family protein